jgi:hypothetical protein
MLGSEAMGVEVERRLRRVVAAAVVVVCVGLGAAGSSAATGTWQRLTNQPSFSPGAMFLLTDGTVMVQDQGSQNNGTGNWWRLSPDSHGRYLDGTWSQAASLPSGYAPIYFASAVLPDGRLAIEGGEFNSGAPVDTNQGAIYDPVANTWTPIAPPNGGNGNWVRIGDAPGVVLANGTFLLGASGYSGTADQALLDASNLTWTTTGAGKADGNGEEGFTLLPNGKVLTVDAKPQSCSTRNSEIYDPAGGTWQSAGLTPAALVDCTDGEIGPQLLMYSGKVFVEGATGANAVYDSSGGTWSAAPSFPTIAGQQYDAADAASALLPDGNVLLNASPGNHETPTHWFVYNGSSLTQVTDDLGASREGSNDANMLLLPTGQVLVDYRLGPGSLELYTDTGTPSDAWRPAIGSVPTALTAGASYTLSGTQLNGLSEGAAFGDDYDPATDYPLVQIKSTTTGKVVYARTSGMSNRSIAPGASSSTEFTLPSAIDDGASQLRVVANGIASAPTSVTISGGTPLPKPKPACSVPKLKGKSVPAARSALTRAHCRLGKVTKKFSSSVKKGRVISQKPSPGKHLPKGAKVAVVVSKGRK